MRVGIPNILPLIGYIVFVAASIFLPFILIEKFETLTVGEMIFPLILMLASFTLFGLTSYHLKILVMTEEKILLLMPFRLLSKTFGFHDISKIDWNILGMQKLGDYRKLTLKTNSDFQMNFSDFEFINYNRLEKWILERTHLKLNLTIKKNIELAQAKENRWWNLIVILMLCVFLILFSINGKSGDARLIIQCIILFLIMRLTIVFIGYQKTINEFNEKRNGE